MSQLSKWHLMKKKRKLRTISITLQLILQQYECHFSWQVLVHLKFCKEFKMRAIEFLFYFFVFQNILNFRMIRGKIIHSPVIAILNLLKTNVIYLFGIFLIFRTDLLKDLLTGSENLKVSPFMSFTVRFHHSVQPFFLCILSLIIFKKRTSLLVLLKACEKESRRSNINFERPLRQCIIIFTTTHFVMFYKVFSINLNFYKTSWMGLFLLLLSIFFFQISFYVLLLGTFFIKFLIHILDDTLEIFEHYSSVDFIEDRLIIISLSMSNFQSAYGLQLSCSMLWILSNTILNVSNFHTIIHH